nr:hypothetical protein [uncultured Draconibacterium sp.]
MKKQILILTFFVAAFFVGTSGAFAQYLTVPNLDADGNVQCITPKPLTNCTGTIDELHPVQGVEYTYTTVTTAVTDDVRWFVVANDSVTLAGDSLITKQNVILPPTNQYIDPADGTGSYILSLGANNDYNLPADGNTTPGISYTGTGLDHAIDITWKFFDGYLPHQVLLVAYVVSEDGCTDNIAVYRIIPQPSFTLDIAVLDDNGDSIAAPGTTVASECVSPIEFATYNTTEDVTPGTVAGLTVDYGENWVYYVVNAANFRDSWSPRFDISYDHGRDSLSAEWTYIQAATNTASSAWHSINIAAGTSPDVVVAGGGNTDGTPINAAGDGVVSATGGECIVVRIRVDHGTDFENANSTNTISFAIDGTMLNPDDTYTVDAGYDDLADATCTDELFEDQVDYQITPRPEVDEGTPQQEVKTGDDQ